jgi:microcystin-dependent protein
MSLPFLGEIRMFAGNFAPKGWEICAGQLLAIQEFAALFSILGTAFGGNGTQTFALPDLRGRIPVHIGQGLSSYVMGQESGAESVSILFNNMPAHIHHVAAVSDDSSSTAPQGNFPAAGGAYSSGTPSADMAPSMLQTAGDNQPIQIRQPYLCVNFIIALDGIYPSRN